MDIKINRAALLWWKHHLVSIRSIKSDAVAPETADVESGTAVTTGSSRNAFLVLATNLLFVSCLFLTPIFLAILITKLNHRSVNYFNLNFKLNFNLSLTTEYFPNFFNEASVIVMILIVSSKTL